MSPEFFHYAVDYINHLIKNLLDDRLAKFVFFEILQMVKQRTGIVLYCSNASGMIYPDGLAGLEIIVPLHQMWKYATHEFCRAVGISGFHKVEGIEPFDYIWVGYSDFFKSFGQFVFIGDGINGVPETVERLLCIGRVYHLDYFTCFRVNFFNQREIELQVLFSIRHSFEGFFESYESRVSLYAFSYGLVRFETIRFFESEQFQEVGDSKFFRDIAKLPWKS